MPGASRASRWTDTSAYERAVRIASANVTRKSPSATGSSSHRIPGRIGLARPAWGLRGPHVAGVVALAGAYYAAANLGYELEFAGPVAAIVWLPAGVAISFLSLGGLRLWPGVLVGDLLANDYSALPLGSALGQTVGNMLEVLVAA